MKNKKNKNNNDENDLFFIKTIIFTTLIVIASYSFKNDGLYIFKDIQNYCYYCMDRVTFELKNEGDSYIYVRKDLEGIDREELIKNIY